MKLLKKISIIMTLVLSITAFYGCKSKEPSPSDTVKTYFDEIKGADEATISTLLSNVEETDTNSSKKMITEIQKLTYTINSESIDGEKATVNVKVNGPDGCCNCYVNSRNVYKCIITSFFWYRNDRSRTK